MSLYSFEAVSLIPRLVFAPSTTGLLLLQQEEHFANSYKHALLITWDAFPAEPGPALLWPLGAFMKMANPSREYSLPLLLNI